MLRYLIISQDKKRLELLEELVGQSEPDEKMLHKFLLSQDCENTDQKRLEEFDRSYDQINSVIQGNDPVYNRFIGIIDCWYANAAKDLRALIHISGMLILAFPEVQWIPMYSNPTDLGAILKKMIELCKGGYSPLFDGDGLRGMLLHRVHDNSVVSKPHGDVAVAIDEETHFAFINAYTAYRFGYRSFPVSTAQCAEALLKKGRNDKALPCAVPDTEIKHLVVFEDVCLNFPDTNMAYTQSIAFGEPRDNVFKLIPDADLRVISTAAQIDEKTAEISEKEKTLTDNESAAEISEKEKTLTDDESAAEISENGKVTIDEFFKKKEGKHEWLINRNSIWDICKNFTRRRLWQVPRDKNFNLSGGWRFYAYINWLEIIGYPVLLLILVCYYPDVTTFWKNFTIGVMIWIFLRFYLRNTWLHIFVVKKLPVWLGRDFFRRRTQVPFMPKLYLNHNPLWEKDSERNGVKYWEIAHKPLAGIFGLRNWCRLPNGSGCSEVYSSSEIKDICSWEKKQENDVKTPQVNGHAAEGMALEIASRLIRRAEKLEGSVTDAEGAVYGAVLAHVALDLLGSKSPAVSLEALQWKHYFEIRAECEFVGIQANLDMEDRYIDIHNSMGKICRSRDMVRDRVFLSGMAEILDRLSELLLRNGKLEEAAFFTNHSRRLHRKLLSPMMRTLLLYPEWVLRSKWNFVLSFACLCVFTVLFWNMHNVDFLGNVVNPLEAYKVMIFGTDLPNEVNPTVGIVTLVVHEVVLLHLGFILAYFLMSMNRK